MTHFEDELDETLTFFDTFYNMAGTQTVHLDDAIDISFDQVSVRVPIARADDRLMARDSMGSEWSLVTTITDKLRLSVSLLRFYDSVIVSNTITISPTLSYYAYATRAVCETVSLDELIGLTLQWGTSISDVASLRSSVVPIYGVTIPEIVSVTATLSAVKYWMVMEAFHLIDAVNAKGAYHRSAADRLIAADAIARFLGASVSDVMAIVETVTRKRRMMPVLTQNVTVADALARGLLLQVIAADEIEITHAQALKLVYKPALAENIAITALHLDPSGSVTAWAVNVQSGAVTEYTNFDFNSFTPYGTKYLGANDSGLYELEGDTDDGSLIIAKMRSGIMQFMQSHTGSIKGAYIGVRGGGDWYLKIVADDKTYIYKVTAKDMKTTKINVGKGLRARYFSYELTSVGQVFDLDSIEFLPIVNQRRV